MYVFIILLQNYKTSEERDGNFLRLIRKRGPNAMGVFVKALVRTGQTHLAEALDPGMCTEVQHDDRKKLKSVSTVRNTNRFVETETPTPMVDLDKGILGEGA